MPQDHYLKFDNQGQADEALTLAFGAEGDSFTAQSDSHFVAVVGTLYRVLGDDIAPEPLHGYHVNVRMLGAALPANLVPFALPPPATPALVFA